MAVPEQNKMTAEEFFEFTQKHGTQRCELLNGKIVYLASPGVLHQTILGEIYGELRNYIRANKGKCKPFVSPFDVKINDITVVQPDIAVICESSKLDDGMRCNGAPDLVIEIASSNRYDDFIRKLSLYMENGVKEYWIVDPQYSRTVVYDFRKNNFPVIFTFDMDIPVGIYNGKLNINISELLQ